MPDSKPSHRADFHSLGDQAIPRVVVELAGTEDVELIWRNELCGLTFQSDGRFIKWNPHSTGIDLSREHERLEWISGRHPAPRVVDFGSDDSCQWMVTDALPGDCAVGDRWRARRPEAIHAIAAGLRALHAVAVDDFPSEWVRDAWVAVDLESIGPRPPIDGPVLVHGDACAPNTIVNDAGAWVGNVDFGDLTIGDRWADLAIASLSLDWNFGEGHQDEFFDAYGTERDDNRVRYYRDLWDVAS